ncbi:MAG: DUF1289 domain-containing protein [Gammaproteobacteria bacterium]
MTRSVPSPCIDVCRFDPQTGWCLGCGRTLDEARQWQKLQPFHRHRIERELPRRLRNLPRQVPGGEIPD